MSQPPYEQQPYPQQPGQPDQQQGQPYQTPGQPYQQPGQPYQQPGSASPGYQGAPPGYQGAPPPPSGYGVSGSMPAPPPGWGAQPPPPQPMARPTTVTYAFYALIANVVLGLIASILIFANRDAYVDDALRDAGLDPTSTTTSDIVDTGFAIGAVLGLVFVALWLMFLWFAWKGYNWARIVIWVLAGLSLIGAFNAFSAPVGLIVVLNVITLLLTLAAVVLLALKPSNDWYRYQGDARRYNWPGRA